MRKISPVGLLVWALLVGAICLPGVFADSIISVGPPVAGVWSWILDTAQDAGVIVQIQPTDGALWTLPGGVASAPTDAQNPDKIWEWIGNDTVLKWKAGPSGAPAGIFMGTAVGATNTAGSYIIDKSSAPGSAGSTVIGPLADSPVVNPVVPEASSLALLSMGLIAGFLFRRRK